MPKPLLLRLQVAYIALRGCYFERHALHRNTCISECPNFLRAIGHEANGGDVEIAQNLDGVRIGTCIDRIAEQLIGFNGIAPLLLQQVRLELAREPDAAPFLREVDEETASLFRDRSQGGVHLSLAVAALGAEDVSGGAGRMEP